MTAPIAQSNGLPASRRLVLDVDLIWSGVGSRDRRSNQVADLPALDGSEHCEIADCTRENGSYELYHG